MASPAPANGALRERKPATIGGKSEDAATSKRRPSQSEGPAFSVLDILRILAGILLLNGLLSYFVMGDSLLWGWRPWFVRPRVVVRWMKGPIQLTDAQLSLYNGTDPALPVYLALNGTIYDVSAGRRIYGPGGSYHVFAGRDAARGFITGCFAEDATPDLRGAEWAYVSRDIPHPDEGVKVDAEGKRLRELEVRKGRNKVRETIEGWQHMFRGDGGKDYFEVGSVVREEGWLEALPRRGLCERAEKGRPKPPKERRKEGDE